MKDTQRYSFYIFPSPSLLRCATSPIPAFARRRGAFIRKISSCLSAPSPLGKVSILVVDGRGKKKKATHTGSLFLTRPKSKYFIHVFEISPLPAGRIALPRSR